MKKRVSKRGYFIILSLFLFLFLINFASALNANFTLASQYYINVTGDHLVNITVGAEDQNISRVSFYIQSSFVNGSNGTSATTSNFTNRTDPIYATYANTTGAGIIGNQSVASFWFKLRSADIGSLRITANATSIDGSENVTVLEVIVNFPFVGYVKNETGSYQNGTNVTIYQYIMGNSGPPAQREVDSVLSNENGTFTFRNINVSEEMFVIKLVYYNSTNSAMKTGAILPPFPANLYYPRGGGMDGMDMTLNGTTFYLQPATTLLLRAHNGTHYKGFGYEVIDQTVGFPVESNVNSNVSSATVIVPAGRSYSVMIIGERSPPVSNSTLGSLIAGTTITINQSISVNQYNLVGCIKVASGANNSLLNVTNIKLKNVPFTTSKGWFIPPSDFADRLISANDTSQLNNSDARCADGIAWFNFSILGAEAGINYILEAYAKNNSEAENPGSSANILAGFLNITMINNSAHTNLTLYRLAGSYWSGGGNLNTSQMKVNIINGSGSAITSNMHIEVSVKNTNAGIGRLNYMIESEDLTNGTFYLPVLNNSNWMKVSVFPNNAPPMEKTMNLSLAENNITLVDIEQGGGGDKGLRRMNSTGGLEEINSTAMPIQIRFLRAGTDQEVTSMESNDFNPLKALVAGTVDLELRILANNISMKFNNFDMFSAKQPPMFATIDNNTLTSSSSQVWKFGNFVPKDVYDNVTITIPYSESNVNETYSYNMSIPTLYNEDITRTHQMASAWSRASGDTSANLSDDFIEYNDSRYRGYLTAAGVQCSKTDSSSTCYMNTSGNKISIEIPHFSGVSPTIAGVAPAVSAATSDSGGGGGGGGGGNGTTTWLVTYAYDEKELSQKGIIEKTLIEKARIKVRVNGTMHYIGIVDITSTSATIEINSVLQTAVFNVGDVKKFDVNEDGYYDVSITLVTIASNQVTISVKAVNEAVPIDLLTASGGTSGTNETTGTGAGAADTEAGEARGLIWAIAILAVLIIAGAIVYFILKKESNK